MLGEQGKALLDGRVQLSLVRCLTGSLLGQGLFFPLILNGPVAAVVTCTKQMGCS